jgi:hypothetical protein
MLKLTAFYLLNKNMLEKNVEHVIYAENREKLFSFDKKVGSFFCGCYLCMLAVDFTSGRKLCVCDKNGCDGVLKLRISPLEKIGKGFVIGRLLRKNWIS